MKRALLLGFAAALVFVLSASAAPGRLDPTFGHRGIVTTAFGGSDASANAVAIQHDGKIAVAGFAGSRLALARYTPRGKLDSTFGSGGKVRPRLGSPASVIGLAIQPDGKFVVVGDLDVGSGVEAVVARFDPSGDLDPTFGSGGVVKTTFGAPLSLVDSVQLQEDGKIVVAGLTGSDLGALRYVVMRLQPNGVADPSFGTAGLVTGRFDTGSSGATALAVRPDGRVLVGGINFAFDKNGIFHYHGFALARLMPDGSVDPTFGADGQVLVHAGKGGGLSAFALKPNGDIVAGGSTVSQFADETDPVERWALIRFHPDGSVDHGFGRHGVVVTKRFGRHADVAAVIALPRGKIIAVGTSEGYHHGSYGRAAVARYRANGRLDLRFGRHGTAVTRFGTHDGDGNAAALQRDGGLVVAGDAFLRTRASRVTVALARYLMK